MPSRKCADVALHPPANQTCTQVPVLLTAHPPVGNHPGGPNPVRSAYVVPGRYTRDTKAQALFETASNAYTGGCDRDLMSRCGLVPIATSALTRKSSVLTVRRHGSRPPHPPLDV